MYAPTDMRILFIIFTFLLSTSASADVVTIKASDGTRLKADWFPPKDKKQPVILTFHMKGSDRTAWAPLQNAAIKEGVGLLNIDMRGQKKPTKPAENKVKKSAPQWNMDVAAAHKFVRKKGIKPQKIILIGAEIGCSAIIQWASTNHAFAAAVLLSPGTQYSDIPSLQHIKKWSDRPLLMVAAADEVETGANKLYKAMGNHRQGIVLALPQKTLRGTHMLGKVKRLSERLIEWSKLRVGAIKPAKKKTKPTLRSKQPRVRKHPGR